MQRKLHKSKPYIWMDYSYVFPNRGYIYEAEYWDKNIGILLWDGCWYTLGGNRVDETILRWKLYLT